jgi:hypothetical protein
MPKIRRSVRKRRDKLVPGLLIRGADGRLYLIRKDKLGAFKLPKKKAKELAQILGGVKALAIPKLPRDVVKEIHVCMECVQLQYPEIKL